MKNRFVVSVIFLLVSCNPYLPATSAPATVTATTQATRTAKPTVTPSPTPPAVQVTAYRSLNVRVRPGEHERVTGYLHNGDVIHLSGRCQDGWAQIQWGSGVAWVNSKFLSENECQTSEEK
jgi:uncharacterized protein YgiM (DUF1202 family)